VSGAAARYTPRVADPPNGADVVADAFVHHGIERIHVFPGGTIAPIFEAAIARNVEIFTARHEQGAGYAALAAARLRGRPEVAMVTSGPGATNLVTPVADAYFDSTPLVAITGQVATSDMRGAMPIRQRGFQEVDTVSMMRPITKEQILPRRAEDVAQAVERAFRISAAGKPGPVLLDLPMNVQREVLSAPTSCEPQHGSAEQEISGAEPDAAELDAIAARIRSASRPVIVAGQGVLLARAQQELRRLAIMRQIPVSQSLLGLGAFPTAHPLALGYHGHTGNQYAGLAIHEADLVLVFGSRLDVRQTGSLPDRFAPGATIVRIELDEGELACSRVRSDLTVHGDVRRALTGLISRLEGCPQPDLCAWHTRIDGWRKRFRLTWDAGGALKPQPIVCAASRLTARQEVVCVTGVGSHQHWVARHFELDFPTRPLLTSGGHGAMGYDLPTAVGAQLARPTSTVLCFVGDGSLQINIQELAAVAEHQLPVKLVVLDNHRLGIVSQFQLQNWDDDPTCGQKWNPDFLAIGAAYGIPGWRIAHEDEIEDALAAAIAVDGPALVHCLIDPHEDVSPMLLAGQTLDGMWPYRS